MDPYRLPRQVIPSRYELCLEPDFTTSTFAGRETVLLNVREQVGDVLFNSAELDLLEATVEGETGPSLPGRITLLEAEERCRVSFPESLAPGTWRLHLRFTGALNDKLRGFYRSTYRDGQGRMRVLAATQFEATDARRAFPCWDEPDFKAVFSATLVVDPELVAISNTAVAAESREGGKKVVRFAETMRMSTYLVAFVVGDLEASEPVLVGRTPLRVWCVPGKRPLTSFAQDIAAFSLRFFEAYYGIPYPGDKLDLLAIPDFASGAMENLGAITFRETALLVNPLAATHAELERIADVVAHENAHMWFGDLVTMSWWNGLWLNEAFATFMEMLAVDAWKPDWQRWTTFGVSRAAALAVDGLHMSRPIEFPVRAPRDAEAMFDVLTYEKGASVLRMLEQHIGESVFRDGVRRYLRASPYGNADTKDLWIAMGEAARQPIPELMDGWIFQPGYPLISVNADAAHLTLRQERFTYCEQGELSRAKMGQDDAGPRESCWQIPLQIRILKNDGAESQRLLLSDPEMTLDFPHGFDSILVNEGGHGFYRVRYSPDLLARLVSRLPDGLAGIERFNVINDAWALTLAGHLAVSDYLDLTDHFTADRDRNVWAVLAESFGILHRVIDASTRPALEAFVRERLAPVVAELGWQSAAGENELRRQLRGDVIRVVGTLGNDPVIQARAADLYAASLKEPASVDPNVLPAVIAILAHAGDTKRYEEFYERYRKAATPQEERRYLYALTAFQPIPLLEATLARSVNGEIRTQDAPFIVRLVLLSVYGRERAWKFVKAQWDAMDRLYPKQGLRRMCEGILGLATPALERDVHTFFRRRRIDLGGKTLAQYLEQLRIAVAFRTRTGRALRRYLERAGRNGTRTTS